MPKAKQTAEPFPRDPGHFLRHDALRRVARWAIGTIGDTVVDLFDRHTSQDEAPSVNQPPETPIKTEESIEPEELKQS